MCLPAPLEGKAVLMILSVLWAVTSWPRGKQQRGICGFNAIPCVSAWTFILTLKRANRGIQPRISECWKRGRRMNDFLFSLTVGGIVECSFRSHTFTIFCMQLRHYWQPFMEKDVWWQKCNFLKWFNIYFVARLNHSTNQFLQVRPNVSSAVTDISKNQKKKKCFNLKVWGQRQQIIVISQKESGTLVLILCFWTIFKGKCSVYELFYSR